MGTPKTEPVEKNVVKTDLAGGLTLETFTVDDVAKFRVGGDLTVKNPTLSKSGNSHKLAGTSGGFRYTDGVETIVCCNRRRLGGGGDNDHSAELTGCSRPCKNRAEEYSPPGQGHRHPPKSSPRRCTKRS